MAVLKDLIVHGSSRFLNKIYANQIQAESGIFNKLIAKDATMGNATVVGLLDVKGQLHTSSWTNSNIATIDGSFYITPTIGSDEGSVAVTATTLSFSGGTYAVESLYLGDESSSSSIIWPRYSKVLVTGQILSNGEWLPLGTLRGELGANASSGSINVINIKDNKANTNNNNSNVLAAIVANGTSSTSYRNLKVSLYQRAVSSTDLRPLGIYMTAAGRNGTTFLDIYGGTKTLLSLTDTDNNAFSGFAEPVLRIGNLNGLPAVGNQTPNGWGIYTTNGYFKGTIAAQLGVIGGWTIASDGLYYGGSSTAPGANNVLLSPGKSSSAVIGGSSGTLTSWVITAGTTFGVTTGGDVYATSGKIGGFTIGTNEIKKDKTSYSETSHDGVWLGTTGIGLGKGLFYVTNAGALTAKSGSIAGWSFNASSLYKTNATPGYSASTMVLSTGTASTNNIGGGGTTSKTWMISAGTGFGVTTAGTLYCNDAHISGEITATSGSIASSVTIGTGGVSLSTIQSNASNGKEAYDLQYSSDTRNKNENPQYYITNYPRKQVNEFKSASTIGLTTGNGYCTLTTIVPWGDSSGGYPKQEANFNGKRYWRQGTSATAWSAWVDASAVATSYITYVNASDGIKVHNASDTTNYLQLNSSAISMYKGGTKIFNVDNNGYVAVGKVAADKRNVYITNSAVQIRNNTTVLAEYGDSIKMYNPSTNTSALEISSDGILVGEREGSNVSITDDDIEISVAGNPLIRLIINDQTYEIRKNIYLQKFQTSSSQSYTYVVNSELYPDFNLSSKIEFAISVDYKRAWETYYYGTSAQKSFRVVSNSTEIFSCNVAYDGAYTFNIQNWSSSSDTFGVQVSYTILKPSSSVFLGATDQENFKPYTVTEGYYCQAIANYSHAEGNHTTASGQSSHAEGNHTTASGQNSHAEANYATASGNYSHAEGSHTTASGEDSHAEGFYTTASGQGSHAEGWFTRASGESSHAMGFNTIASKDYQTAIGKNSIEDVNNYYAFIIGNGTTTSMVSGGVNAVRCNAFAVKWDGDVEIYKDSADSDLDAAITALGWGNEVIV